MEAVRFICGIGSGVAAAVGAVLYIRSIWRGESKPEFWTWLIFAIGISGAAIYTVEGKPGLSGAIFPVTMAVLINIIFIHTWFKKFRYHEGDYEDEKLVWWWHKCIVAPLAFILYALLIGFHWPIFVGVLVGISVDFSALSILAIKSWRNPSSEWWWAYLCGAIGGLLGLFALENWSFTTWAFPVYFAITQAGLVYILLRRKPRVSQNKARAA
jgi:hypothetical protein